ERSQRGEPELTREAENGVLRLASLLSRGVVASPRLDSRDLPRGSSSRCSDRASPLPPPESRPTVPAARSSLLPRIVVLLCLAVVLSLIGWIFSHVRKDHWQQVARARSHLDQGQPDLAFQAVSGIRDDAPGAPEGLTLAARAFLMRGNIVP